MKVDTAKNMNARPSLLKIANTKFLEGNFVEAIKHYVEAIISNPVLAKTIEFNLGLAQKRYRSTTECVEKKKVLICNMSSVASPARLAGLVNAYAKQISCRVVYVSTKETGKDQNLASENDHVSYVIDTQHNNSIFQDVMSFVLTHPCSRVHLASPEFPDVLTGLLYKWIWKSSVLVDVSDEKLLKRISGVQLDIKSHLKALGKEKNADDLYSREWTYVGCSVLESFDFISCASKSLQSKFGGILLASIDDFSRESLKKINTSKEPVSFENNLILSNIFGALRTRKNCFSKNNFVVNSSVKKISINEMSAVNKTTELDLLKDIEIIKNSGLFDHAWYESRYVENKCSYEDAIKHYLIVGFKSGFDPSESFSTDYYFSRYKSVANNGMNPLLHYIKHGRNKGYVPKEIDILGAEGESGNIDIYLSCWLRTKEAIHDGLIGIYHSLRASGFRVKCVTHSEPILSVPNIDAINVSFSLLGTRLYLVEDEFELPLSIEKDIFSVIKTRLLNSGNSEVLEKPENISSLIKKAYAYWFKAFEKNDPKLVIVWGSTCPMSRLHIHLCKQMSIPYLVMERGHFSGTIGVDTIGQFAFGGGAYLPCLTQLNKQKYDLIKTWVSEAEEVPYAHKNSNIEFNEKIEEARKSGRPIVLFIGVNDVGSGIAYDLNSLESHSVYYHASFDALNDLLKALSLVCENALLVVKPHPADLADYSTIISENVIIEQSGNINELIKLSSVCVTMSTTSIARCIIEEKPIVTMSLTDVSGMNIAYECNDPSELVAVLRSAMFDEESSERFNNGKLFIQRLFEDKLFSVSENDFLNSIYDLSELITKRASLQSRLKNIRKLLVKNGCELPKCKFTKFEFDGALSIPRAFWLGVDIVIPVYSDAELSALAIQTALESLDGDSRIIIVNDASPEPEVHKLFDSLKRTADPRLVILENQHNLGFSGTVNRAIEFSKNRDVVLLNSDAIVPPGFLIRMRKAAYSHYRVATATPFSNNAGIYSIPLRGGEPLEKSNALEKVRYVDAVFSVKNIGFAIDMPVGHGFCMYLRRSALNQIGCFNELVFGRGYSEEVDYCLRARALGLINVAVPSVYVGHVGGVSFGSEANAMKIKNRKIIEERYPSYFDEMRAFRGDDPLKEYRVRSEV